MAMSARGILIDLDGVIRFWPRPFDRAIGVGDPTIDDAVFPVAFAPDLLHQAITGAITDEAWRLETVRRLSADWPPDAAVAAVDAWTASRPTIDERVRELVREWRRTVPVVLVTNATSRLTADLTVIGLLGDFDAVVNSSAIGAAKPDPRIFAAALAEVGVAPGEAVFIDDSAGNVEAAGGLGLIGYRFGGDVDRLRRFVGQRLPPGRSRGLAIGSLPFG